VKNTAAEPTGSQPEQRERLTTLALTAWDLRRTRGAQKPTDRSRLVVLKTHARLTRQSEAALGVPEKERSFVLASPDATDGVLLVHGATGSPADMHALARTLHESGMTVACVLQTGYGHGMVSRPESRWRANLQHIRQTLQILRQGCRRVHVVGASFGAALAVHLAAREPVASLVLLAPALVPRVSLGMRLLMALRLHRIPWIRRRIRFTADVLDGMDRARGLLAHLDIPIYAVQCEDDETIAPASVRLLQKKARHRASRFRVFPTGGHDVLTAHGDTGLNDDIRDFIREGR